MTGKISCSLCLMGLALNNGAIPDRNGEALFRVRTPHREHKEMNLASANSCFVMI
jgi:hypothetical protein